MNTFSASSSIRGGWETFKKRPAFFIGASAIALVILWLISFLNGTTYQMPLLFGVGRVVVFLLSVFVDMGMTNFFLKAYANPAQAKLSDLWYPEPYLSYIAAALIMGILVVIGLCILIVPGIILAIMLLFVKFLVVDKNLGPIQALKASAHITKGHRIQLLYVFIFALVINIIGALVVFVGLFITIPITEFVLVKAYRTLEQAAVPVSTV